MVFSSKTQCLLLKTLLKEEEISRNILRIYSKFFTINKNRLCLTWVGRTYSKLPCVMYTDLNNEAEIAHCLIWAELFVCNYTFFKMKNQIFTVGLSLKNRITRIFHKVWLVLCKCISITSRKNVKKTTFFRGRDRLSGRESAIGLRKVWKF